MNENDETKHCWAAFEAYGQEAAAAFEATLGDIRRKERDAFEAQFARLRDKVIVDLADREEAVSMAGHDERVLRASVQWHQDIATQIQTALDLLRNERVLRLRAERALAAHTRGASEAWSHPDTEARRDGRA